MESSDVKLQYQWVIGASPWGGETLRYPRGRRGAFVENRHLRPSKYNINTSQKN